MHFRHIKIIFKARLSDRPAKRGCSLVAEAKPLPMKKFSMPSKVKKAAALEAHASGGTSILGGCTRAPRRAKKRRPAPPAGPDGYPKTLTHAPPVRPRRRARAAKIYIKSKLVKGLGGIGCTISEQGIITQIDPNGTVASKGELAVGDQIVEVNRY
jgi:hypothetical protein